MIQAVPFQRVRVPLLAVGALGLVALAALGAPKLSQSSVAPAAPATVELAPSLAQRPAVAPAQADSSACGANAYVSGDMVGDASPAAVYAQLCPSR